MKVDNRRSVMEELGKYCHLSNKHDFMEVTEWANGEGVDICIQRGNYTEKFYLTNGEYELLQALFNYKGDSIE